MFLFQGSPAFDGFATIVWIHPGNFTTGSPVMWNPHTLVYRHRIIVVTVAWRLGIMGFFTTMDGEATGNYGLFDQQAAMMWVKKNIKLFGGNPDNISLMGYGTGGVSVGLHLCNQASREFFNKAIVMSGNFLSPSAVKYPQEDKDLLNRLAESFGCLRKPTSKLIACLIAADADALADLTSNINWRPLIDAGLSNGSLAFLSELPRNYFERNDYYQVPFLTGYTNMEDILSLSSLKTDYISSENISSDILQQIITEHVIGDIPVNNNSDSCLSNNNLIIDTVNFFYKPTINIKDIDTFRKIIADFTTEKNYAASTYLQATYMSKEQPTFVYKFDMKPVTASVMEDLPEWVAVPHLFDLIYVWGIPYWSEYDNTIWEGRDKRFSDIIMSFWTNFAKSSDPTEGSLYRIKWDAFTKDNPGILIVDNAFNMSDGKSLNYKAFEFWNEYYPKVLEVASQCCNTEESGGKSLFRISYLLLSLVEVTAILFYFL